MSSLSARGHRRITNQLVHLEDLTFERPGVGEDQGASSDTPSVAIEAREHRLSTAVSFQGPCSN